MTTQNRFITTLRKQNSYTLFPRLCTKTFKFVTTLALLVLGLMASTSVNLFGQTVMFSTGFEANTDIVPDTSNWNRNDVIGTDASISDDPNS